MKNFLLGLLCGGLLTTAAMVTAAQVVGENGYLNGWEVTKDGEEICSSPYIWKATREIECD